VAYIYISGKPGCCIVVGKGVTIYKFVEWLVNFLWSMMNALRVLIGLLLVFLEKSNHNHVGSSGSLLYIVHSLPCGCPKLLFGSCLTG